MRILIVDDNYDWININTNMVTSVFGDDTEILAANSANEALNIYKSEFIENPFNLVITDMQMEADFEPLYAGEWLVKEILSLKRTQNILIVSAAPNIEQIAHYYHIDCISKKLIISDIENYSEKLKNIYVF